MSHLTPSREQIELIRYQTIALLYRLADKADEFELPKPPAGLAKCRNKLEQNRYQVLVVGEAKRGKSTFVNALIGQDLLPTDVDIATSQLFHVTHAEEEAYRLRFEDGSTQEITRDELSRYGSQVVANLAGRPHFDQIIRWIEVEVPIQFLPQGVSILDTPGLGSLYAPHTQITQRFVPHADAVIYMLDSSQPMGQPDIEFIETILGVTPHIFFIQSKIDRHRRKHWQVIQQRNETILIERFSNRLTDTRVWPISSTNLIEASQTGDEDYRIVSRHPEMSTALQAFLFRVAGWSRAAQAIVVAQHDHTRSRQRLAARLATLTEESAQKRAERQQVIAQRQQQFEARWGQNGTEREQLMEIIKKVATIGRRSFEEALQAGGVIERKQRRQIEALQSVQEAAQFGKRMNGEVIGDTVNQWREMCQYTQTQSVQVLPPFLAALDALTVPYDISAANIQLPSAPLIKQEWHTQILAAAENAVEGAGRDWLEILLNVSMISLDTGLMALGAAGLWQFVRAWTTSEQAQLQEAQEELHTHLALVLQEVQDYFFAANMVVSRLSLLEEYFNRLERRVFEQMEALVAQKSAEAQTEIARLTEEAQLDDAQRQSKATQTRQQVAEWDQISGAIQKIVVELQGLQQY